MTQSPEPVDPTTVAETEAGSVEYGGNEIHGEAPADTGSVTTEAGTFEDLPVTPDEQTE